MRSFVSRALVLALCWLAAGCGEDVTSAVETLSGRYQLSTVNGQRLPALVRSEPNYRKEATGGWTEFDADQTFVWRLEEEDTEPEGTTTWTHTYRGSWNQQDDGLELTIPLPPPPVIHGRIENGAVTVTVEGGPAYGFTR